MIIIIFLAWNQTLALKNGRNLWSPHSPGVWTRCFKKGMDMLIPFILYFSNIFDSDPQEIHFASKSSTQIHTHREKRISTITIYEVYIFSPFYLVRLHFLKCCVYMTKLILWQLMVHGLQFGIYCFRLYLTFIDTVKSLSEKNGAI